jgi:pentatricopeptide repeat protein
MFQNPTSFQPKNLVNQLNILCQSPQDMQKVNRENWTIILKLMADHPHYDFWTSVQNIIHHLLEHHKFVLPDELFALAAIGKNYVSDFQSARQIFSAYLEFIKNTKDPHNQTFLASSKFWGPLVMALVDLQKPTDGFQLAVHIQESLAKNTSLPSECYYLSAEQCCKLAKGLYRTNSGNSHPEILTIIDVNIKAINEILQWIQSAGNTHTTIHATWIFLMREILWFRSNNIPFSVPMFVQKMEQKQLPFSEALDYQLYLMADPKDPQYPQLESKCLLKVPFVHESTPKIHSLSGIVIWRQLMKLVNSSSVSYSNTSIWDMVDIVLADFENVKRQIPASRNLELWRSIINKMVARSKDPDIASQVWLCYQTLFRHFGLLLESSDIPILVEAILRTKRLSLEEVQQILDRIMNCSEELLSQLVPMLLQRASETLSAVEFHHFFSSMRFPLHRFVPVALIRSILANLQFSREDQLKNLSSERLDLPTVNWDDRWNMVIAYLEWLSKHDRLRPNDMSFGLFIVRDQIKSPALLKHTLQNLHGFKLSLLKDEARRDVLVGLILNECSEGDILQVLHEFFPTSHQLLFLIKILVALQKGYVDTADQLLTDQKRFIQRTHLEHLSSSLGIHLIEREEYEKLKRLCDFLIRHGQQISPQFAAQYLKALISRSLLEDAFDLVHYMRDSLKKQKSDIVSGIYSDLVAALAKGKQAEKAELVISWMKKDQIELNTYSFSHIIAMYSFQGDMSKAWEWLEAMIESQCLPTISTYVALMSGMLMHDDMDNLEKALNHLISRNIRPSSDIYGILLASLFRRGQVQKAIAMFNDTAFPLCSWKCSAYAIVLDGMMDNGADINFIEEHLKRFKSSGLAMEPILVASAVSAFCQLGFMSKAEAFIENSIKDGGQECISPGVYSKLLQGYLRTSHFDEAISLFNKLLEDSHPRRKPDSNMFALVIHYLCVSDKMENAEEYLELALSRGMDLTDTNVYATLIRYWAENRGQLDRSWTYYRKIKSIRRPTAIEHASILFAYRNLGKNRQMLVLANKIASNPKERAHNFGYHGYFQIFMSLIALKRYPQVISMFNEIVSPEKANIHPRAEIYVVLLELFKAKKKWDQVVLLWKCLRPNVMEQEGPFEKELLNQSKSKLEIEYRIPREFQQLTSITEDHPKFKQQEPVLYQRMLKIWITSIRHLASKDKAILILKELESHQLPHSLILTLLNEYLSLSGYQEAFNLCTQYSGKLNLWKHCVAILQKRVSLEESYWLDLFTTYAELNHDETPSNVSGRKKRSNFLIPMKPTAESPWDTKEPSTPLTHDLKFLSNRGPNYHLQRIQGKHRIIILNTGLYSLDQYLAAASNYI